MVVVTRSDESVGSCVGRGVGARVEVVGGVFGVGKEMAVAFGCDVGMLLDRVVGIDVGIRLGGAVGEELGALVGIVLGKRVGPRVGIRVGL